MILKTSNFILFRKSSSLNGTFDDLIEELHLNNYQVKKLLSEIQAEIKSWKLENYYLIDLQTQKSFVRYERRTQGNIMLLLNHYVKRSQMQALIRAIFTEEVNKIAELEDVVFYQSQPRINWSKIYGFNQGI